MNLTNESTLLAKILWDDPQSGETHELMLPEGGTASIGRLETNDICIKEQHVSRQHAVIAYRDGVFMITDLGSANGVFVNDQRLTEAYPLAAGDEIRLYVPLLHFAALVEDDHHHRHPTSLSGLTANAPENSTGQLIISSGPQEGTSIPLLNTTVTVGRATTKADWEVCLQDPSVSRPHARMERIDNNWVLYDLGSANGTLVNGTPVNEKGRVLRDGDVVSFASTMTLFRTT